MCLTMFNHIQPMFNPFGLAGTAYGQIWPFWVKKGRFRALLRPPSDISGWSKRLKLTPPGCEIQCSTMFNQCSTQLGLLGLPMAKYGHFGVKKGRFRALLRPPTDISGWAKRPKLTPPEVENIIQPCSPNVQPIWGCRDCVWPNMAFFSLKKAILGGSRAPQ